MSEHHMTHSAAALAGISGDSVFARVCAYWAILRENGTAPKRSAVDPRALGDALPHVFLAELVAPRVARLRICGHKIEDLMGMDMRGMPLTVLFQGNARDAVAEAVEQVSHGARVILSLEGETGFGLPEVKATLALMPLADDTGRITRMMGVIERRGEPGRTPRRFGLATPVSEQGPAVAPAPARPTLRVIDGGRG